MFYSLNDVYVVGVGAFLPGRPIENHEMENVLGMVADKPSRYRSRILRSNGIKQRYYAMDENGSGKVSYQTDEMAALAVLDALAHSGYSENDIDMLSVGTSLADLLLPGIASMVHGRIGHRPMDILSCSGVCGAGAAALKSAENAVRAGQHACAVACASERPSAVLKASRFELESEISSQRNDEAESFKYFNADFLRWMLSDGAGAVVLSNKPSPLKPSLRIDWMETYSFANELDTCMYMGTNDPVGMKAENTWLNDPTFSIAEASGKLLVRQDTRLLAENIVKVVVRAASMLCEKGFLDPGSIDHFLPHISSLFFYEKLYEELGSSNLGIPYDRWFTNLTSKGNTGSASIYIMLDEAMKSGRFREGDRILLMIPESGRFSVSYCHMTCITQ